MAGFPFQLFPHLVDLRAAFSIPPLAPPTKEDPINLIPPFKALFILEFLGSIIIFTLGIMAELPRRGASAMVDNSMCDSADFTEVISKEGQAGSKRETLSNRA